MIFSVLEQIENFSFHLNKQFYFWMAKKGKKTINAHSALQLSQSDDDDDDKKHNENDIEIETTDTATVKQSLLQKITIFLT